MLVQKKFTHILFSMVPVCVGSGSVSFDTDPNSGSSQLLIRTDPDPGKWNGFYGSGSATLHSQKLWAASWDPLKLSLTDLSLDCLSLRSMRVFLACPIFLRSRSPVGVSMPATQVRSLTNKIDRQTNHSLPLTKLTDLKADDRALSL